MFWSSRFTNDVSDSGNKCRNDGDYGGYFDGFICHFDNLELDFCFLILIEVF